MSVRKSSSRDPRNRLAGVIDQDKQIESCTVSLGWSPIGHLRPILTLPNYHIFTIYVRHALVLTNHV